MGISVNIATAFLISRVQVQTLAVLSALIDLISPILMVTVKVDENYWFSPFWALLLSPVNPDGTLIFLPPLTFVVIVVYIAQILIHSSMIMIVLFTVSNLVISDAFPTQIQSLAGGVFNEIAQFGNAVGLAVTAAIAASVTDHSGIPVSDHEAALMRGYRASVWTIFASALFLLPFSG